MQSYLVVKEGGTYNYHALGINSVCEWFQWHAEGEVVEVFWDKFRGDAQGRRPLNGQPMQTENSLPFVTKTCLVLFSGISPIDPKSATRKVSKYHLSCFRKLLCSYPGASDPVEADSRPDSLEISRFL